jgi:hypothetical protein
MDIYPLYGPFRAQYAVLPLFLGQDALNGSSAAKSAWGVGLGRFGQGKRHKVWGGRSVAYVSENKHDFINDKRSCSKTC